MAELTQEKKDLFNKLFKEYGLKKEHFFQHKHYTLITRAGIERIQSAAGINVTYEPVVCSREYACIKGYGINANGVRIETFGSACSENSGNSYYAEMAEKRALSRLVLKLTGLYAEGDVYGSDEFSDKDIKEERGAKIQSYGKGVK